MSDLRTFILDDLRRYGVANPESVAVADVDREWVPADGDTMARESWEITVTYTVDGIPQQRRLVCADQDGSTDFADVTSLLLCALNT